MHTSGHLCNAPINCKPRGTPPPPPPPPPRETTGIWPLRFPWGWGIWPQGGLPEWAALTDASLHCDLCVHRGGAVWPFRLSPGGDLGYIWPHPGQIPTISQGGGGTVGHAIDRCIKVKGLIQWRSFLEKKRSCLKSTRHAARWFHFPWLMQLQPTLKRLYSLSPLLSERNQRSGHCAFFLGYVQMTPFLSNSLRELTRTCCWCVTCISVHSFYFGSAGKTSLCCAVFQ